MKIGILAKSVTEDFFNKSVAATWLFATFREDHGKDKLESVKFDSFSDAPTIKFAVTGDVPPVDYIAPDGKASGFNVAILAEIGRRVKINIELMNIKFLWRSHEFECF